MQNQKWLRYCLFLLLLGVLGLPTIYGQANTPPPVGVEIFGVDSRFYPDMKVTLRVADNQNGRLVELTPAMLSATYNGQPTEVLGVEPSPRDVAYNFSILFDLTTSQSNTQFLQEQKSTAETLIGKLRPGDGVAIVSFSGRNAQIVAPLSLDHGGALNAVGDLRIPNENNNVFLDGMALAVQALEANLTPSARQAVIVLTDTNNALGTASQSDIIARAQALNAPIYIIGFNEADRALLEGFSAPTGGYTYILREQLQGRSLDTLAQNLATLLTGESVVNLRASAPATNTQGGLVIAAQVGSTRGESDPQLVTATSRQLTVTFPNLPTTPVSNSVRFEPRIVYADSGASPNIVKSAYYVETGIVGQSNVLAPPDTSNPVYIWDIKELSGGDYSLRIEVEDEVGNIGTESFVIRVASPLSVSITNPPATTDGSLPLLPIGTVTIVAEIQSDFGIDRVRLLVNGAESGTLTKNSNPYEFELVTTGLTAGQYSLRVEAFDVQNSSAFDEQIVQISINQQELPVVILVLIAILVALFVLILIAVILRRRNLQRQAVAVGNESIPVPMPDALQQQAIANLVVVRGAVAGQNFYPLANQPYTVGRSNTNQIRLMGQGASRNHAIIDGQSGQFIYRDLAPNKPNRTHINGIPLMGAHMLRPGDRIVVGDTEFEFRQ